MQGESRVEVGVRLHPEEWCFASMIGRLIETRTVTRGVNYGGSVMRFSTGIPGLSYRVGSFSVARQTEDVDVVLDRGTLYITSARLLFVGEGRSWTLPYSQLLAWEVFDNGVYVEKAAGRHQFFELSASDPELVNAVLVGATRQA